MPLIDNKHPLNIFKINTNFRKILNQHGALFLHSNKGILTLIDIFIFPDLRSLEGDGSDIYSDITNSEILTSIDQNENKLFLVGSELSGKTALCKRVYMHYYDNSYIPIYIEGARLRETSMDLFLKLLNTCFIEQYDEDALEQFEQLDNKKKLIIIDGFDKTKLNLKYRYALLDRINKHFPNIIITSNNYFQIEEIVYEENKKENIFDNYRQYEILEYGHRLRSKMISEWNKLGVEEYVEESDLVYKNDNAQRIVDTIIGRNLVPAYPFFLFTILQSIEVGTSHNLKESSYGYYYDLLITQALGRINIRNDEIDAYNNYITELANYFFENKVYEVTLAFLTDFHNWFCEEYAITPNLKEYTRDLLYASILECNSGLYRFRYKYVYYYFVAKYAANNISSDKTRNRISYMCNRLHNEEYANIIMFLTHLSKDPFVLNEIIENAKKHFSEIYPVTFDRDIVAINKLIDTIPKLVYKNIEYKEVREKMLDDLDKAELPEKIKSRNGIDSEGDQESYDDISELDLIAKLNLSFKTIEIIGQVLKNYYGSLRRSVKYSLCEEAYSIGLRLLNLFCTILEEHSDYLVSEISTELERRKIVDRDQVEEYSRKLLFNICSFVTYGYIKKISGSIGSEKLSETYSQIINTNDTTAVNLIDISIKLDFYRAFPHDDIKRLKGRLRNNLLPFTLLKKMVINYLYMFPTSHHLKQKICNMLDIPLIKQHTIDLTATQRKRVPSN